MFTATTTVDAIRDRLRAAGWFTLQSGDRRKRKTIVARRGRQTATATGADEAAAWRQLAAIVARARGLKDGQNKNSRP
jgi:hypothetical protein